MTSTDTSTSAYIARIQGNNIVSSIVGNTPAGTGYQRAFALAKVISVLEASIVQPVQPEPPVQPIPPPTNLRFQTKAFGAVAELIWTNNAADILDTLIEKETDVPGVFEPIIHEVLGSLNTYTAQVSILAGKIRVSSITAAGTSAPSNTRTVPPFILG